jgi:hypothetical protein
VGCVWHDRDVLLDAYWCAFASHEPVALILRTYVPSWEPGNWRERACERERERERDRASEWEREKGREGGRKSESAHVRARARERGLVREQYVGQFTPGRD